MTEKVENYSESNGFIFYNEKRQHVHFLTYPKQR